MDFNQAPAPIADDTPFPRVKAKEEACAQMSAILGSTTNHQLVSIGDSERTSGLYILGKPRVGKSWLIVNLILQDT